MPLTSVFSTRSPSVVLNTLYKNLELNAFPILSAEYERLAEYEDTGLEPWEIKQLLAAAEVTDPTMPAAVK